MADLRLLSSGHDLVIKARDEVGTRVVTISGEADLQTEHRLSAALRDALNNPGRALIVDMTSLRFCSAYAMSVLVDMIGSAAHRGISVAVVGLPPVTARVWLLSDVPVPVQYASVELAVAAMATVSVAHSSEQIEQDAGTARLLIELGALRQALASRAVIEQAKGMLMERLTCTSDEAFNLIVLQAQQTAKKLHDIAAEYVRSGADGAAIHALTRLADGPEREQITASPPNPTSAA